MQQQFEVGIHVHVLQGYLNTTGIILEVTSSMALIETKAGSKYWVYLENCIAL
jgi:hypothetical protein